ncbi:MULTISPECIES: alpha/beta fold hydrolase [unclassified Sphingomonas]|uniref:alpha/beta fold hydrolase n=1 Tax=unclassified Sphingomonas TaxID=196159 RepID=UPI0006F25F62|nr:MULTISPECIES: alpha/beta hydrolase [unclassified Sphingomonas]KQM62290.1 alpha/beta hydrolase [Sphingomonas sp. Leaf16]KQN13694.1 alpha/beta hydrolase [Sphingomonas sp. Leaf29]KQN23076.1 alpha/beta hydrolase [Sphingomonas sp. Leaf32]
MTAPERWTSVVTQSVTIGDVSLAYRRLGPTGGVPVMLLNHWGANLDNFDPAIVEGLAADRPVYALDYRGIGASGGAAPRTIAGTATDIIAAIHALAAGPVDVIGFSFGGFVAQQILLDAPDLVRRAILAGTGPAGGAGIARVGAVSWPLILKGLMTFRDPKTYLFFTGSAKSRRAAADFLRRLKLRIAQRDKAVGMPAFLAQLAAIKAWGLQPAQPLDGVRTPVLVVNGDHDIMVPSENSRDLARRISGAGLILYPDAGHGGIFQYHDQFLATAKAFLVA